MRFLVCLKQVPDSTVRVKVGSDGRSIATDGITWSISPYDEYAIELALERKDADPSTVVSVVAVGAARTKDALRQALAMGCDDATLVVAEGDLAGLDVAKALAAVVREMKPDVVLCGKQASDDDQGLVGPALAEALGWPHVGMLTKLVPAGSCVEMWREVEGGHEVWNATPPVVGLVHKSEKEPRYPSLPGIMKAKKKEIPEKDLASLGVTPGAPRLEILAMEPPPQRGQGRIFKLDGDAKGVAEQIAKALHEEAKVL
ncbi:MAG TPA: electron transfer flavoprotein subunit beta/FixA family protein [Candidatus Limnocylindria bacterium]|nr:electron transfer flavoprotein subunit beta/FixA family protein [Candidatus Limnocylindria bacterium]